MKYPILGRERRRPIALSAVGTVLVARVCLCTVYSDGAGDPAGLLSDTLAAFWEDKLLIPLNIFPVMCCPHCVLLLDRKCIFGGRDRRPGRKSTVLYQSGQDRLPATTPSSRRTVHCSGRLRMRWGIISWISTGVLWLQFCC